MRRIVLKIGVIIITSFFFFQTGTAYSYVSRVKNKTYLVDQTGEKWDVTQAKSIGFDPHSFQYGIGKNAFTTLNDSHLKDNASSLRNSRVIGIANESESQAYSISKLRSHEIANTTLGSNPIAVGYWPLVNLAAVYSRRIDDVTLHLAPSGWTYKNTFVLYDLETGTLWYPYRKGLMGIQGNYFKRWLPKIPSNDTRWSKWKDNYPDSKILE